MRIKVDPTIPDGDKVTAGVRPVNPQRRRIIVPDSAPQIGLQEITTSGHLIGFSDAESPQRGKPFGATRLQLFRRFKDQPGESLRLVGCYTRGPIRVVYDGRSNGRTVVYLTRWMSRRGEVGQWSRALELPVVAIAPLPLSRRAA